MTKIPYGVGGGGEWVRTLNRARQMAPAGDETLLQTQHHHATHGLVIDWDETITVNDTLSLVASQPLAPYTASYLDDYNQFALDHPRPTTIDEERQWQRALAPIEAASIARLELGRALQWPRHPPEEPLPQLRPGFISAARKCNALGVPLVILSLNWSLWWMKRSMNHYGIRIADYITNEVDFASGMFADAKWGKIHTGADKARVMAQLNATSVKWSMVGDLRTDILAMIDANGGGIVIRDGANDKVGLSAIKALANLGVSVEKLEPIKGKVVWWTWQEIEAWIDSMPPQTKGL